MPLCGAKTRSGGRCKKPAMKNGRCRNHGGATPETNQNARKHGIYSKVLLPEEQALFDEAPLGSLDAEIRLLRVQINRALKAQRDKKNKDKNFDPIIDRYMGRLGELETRRADLMRKPVHDDSQDVSPVKIEVNVVDARSNT